MNRVAIDIGGTKVVAGLFRNGKMVRKIWHSTAKDKEIVLLQILESLYFCMNSVKRIEGIYVSCAGPLKNGKILNPPNLKALHGFDIKKFIQSRVKKKVAVGHDSDCFALYLINKKRKKDFVLLAVGTGVGSSVVIGKRIFKGEGMGTEIGHSVVDFDGRQCECGRKGCLEMYSSGKAIWREHRKVSKMVYLAAKKGNKQAKRILNEFGHYLGIGAANAVNIFTPEEVVIAGGVSGAQKYFKKPLLKEVKKAFFPTKISFLAKGDYALKGALYL